MLKELKQKKCSNCKYNVKTKSINCCGISNKEGMYTLKPLKLICFRKKRKE